MKQIVSNYTYSPTANCVTLTGLNIDQDQLLLVVAPEQGRTLYNFASVTGSVIPGSNTRINLSASTAGLTTSSPLVIFYDDQASAQVVTGTVALDPNSLIALENVTVTVGSSVSISNFPSTQTIAGTVTANGLALGQEIGNVFPIGIGQVGGGGVRAVADYQGYYAPVAVREIPSVMLLGANGDRIDDGGLIPVIGPNGGDVIIAGTVTANVPNLVGQSATQIPVETFDNPNSSYVIPVALYDLNGRQEAIGASIGTSVVSGGETYFANAVSYSGTFGPYSLLGYVNTKIVAGSVTIGSLPAISGTVTANAMGYDFVNNQYGRIPLSDGGDAVVVFQNYAGMIGYFDSASGNTTVSQGKPLPVTIQTGTVTIGSCVTHGVRLQDGSGNNLTSTSIGGVQRLNVSLASAATAGGTLPSFINIHGGTDGSVARTMLLDSSGRTVVTVSNFPATQPVSLASTTVTVSALPSGALTTRFGSVTTANTAQLTAAVTNSARKYLLCQNISSGTVTIGIGFSPTTTQGIQLSAGGGLSFDSFCPTGAVYWLGATTGTNFTILEG